MVVFPIPKLSYQLVEIPVQWFHDVRPLPSPVASAFT